MPWVQVTNNRVYCESIVKARAMAAKVLEGVHHNWRDNPWYHSSTGVPIYSKATSRKPSSCVRYYMGKPGDIEWVKYTGQYGVETHPLYKNGKLM